jgi:uncharacterized protein (DUF1800 family)
MAMQHNGLASKGVVRVATLMGAFAISACGGGSSGSSGPPPPPPPPPITKTEAFQLLNQASFGATEAASDSVIQRRIEGWLDDQFQQPASLQLPHLRSLPQPQFPGQIQPDRVDIWFRNSLSGNDQLRQRVAFALSEIMVVSQLGALQQAPYSLASYYDMLAQNAFGNFRDLLEDVTLHPAMGVYLSMLGNERPNPALNIRPDENYARELMQLFTIGLVELNIDGSVKLDNQGVAIPTYNQQIIEGFAHVYTGWNYAGAVSFQSARRNQQNQTIPMQLYPNFHDTGAKMLLNGEMLPAGQTGDQDLAGALDNIFNHPNVGPFIAQRLIERLVTSNPSPQYVTRVAESFNNNGSGVRGDLGAVLRAILLDAEARPATPADLDGKLKEPILRLTQLWRAYNAISTSGRYPIGAAYILFGQGPLQSPSVFNFFSPFYAPSGEIADGNLVAPELQLATEYQNTLQTNVMAIYTFSWNSANVANLEPDNVYIDISEEMAVADDVNAVIDIVADKLLAGEISTILRTEMSNMIGQIPEADTAARAAEAVYLVVTSPEYAYQH